MSDTRFHDFRPDQFPITMRAFRCDTGVEVWSETVHEPFVAVYVPPLRKIHGVPIRTRVEFGNGTVQEHVEA